jgi:Tol biopolymer transport system component
MRRTTRLLATAALVLLGGLLLAAFSIDVAWTRPLSGEGDGSAPAALAPTDAISPTSFFVLYGAENASGDEDIRLMDAVTDTQFIADAWRPVLSPSGRYVAYQAEAPSGGWHVYVRDLISMTDTAVFTITGSLDSYGWTLDESRVVFDHECLIYSVSREGGDQQTLIEDWPSESSSAKCFNDAPQVNPVDGRLVWTNWQHTPALAVSDADGQNPAWIPNTQAADAYPVWSPDGEWIVFNRGWVDLYKIKPDGSELTRLSWLSGTTGFVDDGGTWSADGAWVVWSAMMNGDLDVYAVDAAGSGLMVPLDTVAGWWPNWVGGVGLLDIDVRQVFLPLMMRNF